MKNNFVLYFRNLCKEKTRLLNISALAITLTFSLLILFFIEDELSYDRWNRNLNNIYRIETHEKWPAKEFHRATSTICTGPMLKREFPEIKSFVRFVKIRNPVVSIEEREFKGVDFYFADPSIFEIFPYELIAGSERDVLANPNSVVLTKNMADKYFGHENPIGNSPVFVTPLGVNF